MERIVCNPMNLEYRYQFKKGPLGTAVFREAADPTLVLFRDTYYLFPSMSGGFWYSDDLFDWHYHTAPELPVYDYAPDVREINGKLAFCASKRGEKCTIFASADPLHQPFTAVSTSLEFWDPNLFQDDDGRVYLYWGCDTRHPIYGIELDPERLTPIGKKTAIVCENQADHGWERVGENNKLAPPKNMGERLIRLALGTKPCIEGSYMTKHQGKYYFQYATPGTEHNIYSDGVYIGDSPLGPFTYQQHNPFSSKPGGFITAAGHGSTFRDKQGRWWHVSTMRISENDNYERRIGLWPCDFDDDGILHCNQSFGDYPFLLDGSDRMDCDPRWMLLSYQAKVTASSSQPGYEPENAADENIRTHWVASTKSEDEWLCLDLGAVKGVKLIQVNFADHKLPLPALQARQMVRENIGRRRIYLEKQKTGYLLEGSADGENWKRLKDTRRDDTDFTHDLIVLDEVTEMRYIRLCEMTVAMNGVPAVSGLRVFGEASGKKPAKVPQLRAQKLGEINVLLQWDAAEGAKGYNVRYGTAPDKLYSSWQLYGQTALDLSTISKGQDWYARVDSFNENGVTHGDVMCISRR